jgi:vacuolar-type H+-ATPase subunit H
MHSQFKDSALEDILAEARRRARRLVRSARDIAPGTGAEQVAVRRCLEDLEACRIIGRRSDNAIDTLRRVVLKELETETTGTFCVFEGYHDPEHGDVGEVRELARRTPRGDELAELARLLEDLQEARDAACDRFRAEQEVRSLL